MTNPYTTTLADLRRANACRRGYDLIANHVGRDFDGPILLETILDVNGLDDCIWALQATDGGADLAVAFSIYCAEPYCTDSAWRSWAADWMSGKDRSERAAAAAEAAAEAAAGRSEAATAWAVAAWAVAAWAARAAERAAKAAAWATAAWAAAAAEAARVAARSAKERATERQRQTDILRWLVRGGAA